MFESKDFIIFWNPESRVILIVFTSDGFLDNNLRSQDFPKNNALNLEVNFRKCIIGDKQSNKKCIPCPAATYSLKPEEEHAMFVLLKMYAMADISWLIKKDTVEHMNSVNFF